VENVGHDFVRGQEVVSVVDDVDDALFGLAEEVAAGYATQYEETQVVRVDGGGAINHLTGFVLAVKCLPHEMDVLGEGLTKALPEHEVVQQREGAGEGPAIQPLTKDLPRGCGAVGASTRDALDRLVSAIVL
jgi:hypothetical protein